MKLPSRDIILAGGLVCPSMEVNRGIWLEHVVKHPLGVGAMAWSSGREPWSREGWDKLEPPVVTASERDALVREIAALSAGKLRCEVPELRGKKIWSNIDRLACRDCQAPIVMQCEKLIDGSNGVGARYASTTESLLAELAEGAGLRVELAAFHQALHRSWLTPEALAGLVVLTVGLDDRRAAGPVARINRDDGTRAEFYLEEPDRLRWKTTYRKVAETRTGLQKISFLSDVPRPAPRLGPVSELCVVARHWWETHGI